MSKKLKGVCVGAGYFSRFHYEAWARIPEVAIVAICNRSTDKAQEIADEHEIPRVTSIGDFEKVLCEEKPDFVDIITPPETHLELCQIAARQGVDIICQKPLAPTYEETVELAALAQKSSGRFMIHENWRWQPWYRELKRVIEAGTLGEIYHFSMQTRLGDGWGEDAYLARQPFFRDYPRLFTFETEVHFLDTFRFLFGEMKSIYARTGRRNPVIKGEDSALIVCEMENGITAMLDANRYNECEADDPRYTFGKFRIEGNTGHLEMNEEGHMQIKLLGQPSVAHAYEHEKRQFAGDCVHALQQHFVTSVFNDTPFESTAEDYLKSVQLVEQAYRSAAENRVVAGSL